MTIRMKDVKEQISEILRINDSKLNLEYGTVAFSVRDGKVYRMDVSHSGSVDNDRVRKTERSAKHDDSPRQSVNPTRGPSPLRKPNN